MPVMIEVTNPLAREQTMTKNDDRSKIAAIKELLKHWLCDIEPNGDSLHGGRSPSACWRQTPVWHIDAAGGPSSQHSEAA